MTQGVQGQTAKIYQFPIRDRIARTGYRESPKALADLASARFSPAEHGSGWYHEAAIQEAEQTRKR